MVKRLLSVVAVVAMTLAASAQAFMTAPVGSIQKKEQVLKPGMVKSPTQPRKVELAENQLIMGTYATDELASSESGLGLTGYPGTLSAASYIPHDVIKDFDGGKVVKMRVGLSNSATVKRMFIIPVVNGNPGNAILSQEVSFNSTGWNEVELEAPVTLDFSGNMDILMGFDYVQSSNQQSYNSYPLSFVNVGDVYPVYIYGNLGQGTGWYSLGTSYGNLSVQAVVESDNFPEKKLILDNLTVPNFVGTGEDIPFELRLHNFGTKNIEEFDINFVLGSDLLIAKQFKQTVGLGPVTVTGELPARLFNSLKPGNYTLKAFIFGADGESQKYIDDGPVKASFYFYDKKDEVKRQKYLLEELTSHSCTYCPYGTNIVQAMHSTYDDVAIACIHGNQSRQDPWNTPECEALNTLLGLTSWPSGCLSRIYNYDGDALPWPLGYNPQYAQQIADMFHEVMQQESQPAFATVDIKAEADGKKLSIVVSGSGSEAAQEMLSGSSLTVYVTEDGIIGQQLNVGTWVNNFEHNHVLRDVVTEVVGDDLKWISTSSYENSYEVTLGDSWKLENLKVVAFIAQKPTSATNPDRKQMAVSNANDATIEDVTAIRSISTTDSLSEQYYTIDGKRIAAPQRGLNIVRMGNGKVVKTIVK